MKPTNIFIVRHGQSEGNADRTTYSKKPDYALLLTQLGVEQARAAGRTLRDKVGDQQMAVYYSPFFRARQTMDEALRAFEPDQIQFKREEARLREQEWAGNLGPSREEDEEERESFGRFYYRFDRGESGADVEDRVGDFLSTLYRDFARDNYPTHVAIFGHSMTNRLLLKRWFHVTVEEFETWGRPENGHIYRLSLIGNGKYHLNNPPPPHEVKHEYQYPKKGA